MPQGKARTGFVNYSVTANGIYGHNSKLRIKVRTDQETLAKTVMLLYIAFTVINL